jgi:DNA replication protein DnaC
MTDAWTPPSKRNPRRADLAGLGIPDGHYRLPSPDAYLDAGGSRDGAARIDAHFHNEIPLADLQPAEVTFLRTYFTRQIEEQLAKTLAHFNATVPRRYAKVEPDDTAHAWAKAVAADADDVQSLLIVGPTGTGKTHYAYAVLRAIAETGRGLDWAALTAADLYASLRPRPGADSEAEFTRLANIDVLFLDDLGAAKVTEWTEEVTYRLINRRYEQCKPSLFTSNVPPAQLRDALGERISSRLVEMCERVVLKGHDRRRSAA